ncbi:OLC1v1028737C1 [Oldenlandia corymbosa var. corymbosa]|uniref:OLC1v1028737C1 n=1 Tax=Oldenlandia corymbosa var. corymbosa TaxID=529605 RepID=A0AAV1CFI6_OLDCO|nr:OLC1v1028737C1 [Oldenlandia corymbosa var. corymbosa]
MAGYSRWIKPEVYPLLAPVGAVVGLMAMQLVRNVYTNPEVRVTKQNRAAGVLENFEEGERYSQHFVRRFVRGKRPEVMPNINKFFSDPE